MSDEFNYVLYIKPGTQRRAPSHLYAQARAWDRSREVSHGGQAVTFPRREPKTVAVLFVLTCLVCALCAWGLVYLSR